MYKYNFDRCHFSENTEVKKITDKNFINKSSGYIIKSAIKAFRALEIIGDYGGLGTSELSRRLGISKTTAFNILCTLEKLEYVKQDRERGNYFLTSKILELSSKLEFDLREVAKPNLRELCRQVDETINLVIRTGTQVLYIEKVESSQPIQINTKIGKKEDLYCTAVGKSIMAYTNEDTREIVFDKINFFPRTDNTIVFLEEFKEELIRTQARGYAVDDEEFSKGVKCIAAPVFNHNDDVAGAISITGPVERMEEKGEENLAIHVKKTCKIVTEKLGGAFDV